MSTDRTVLENLLDGRAALVLEVSRLTSALEELDSVIARIGGALVATGRVQDTGPATPAQVAAEPVKPPVEVEPAAAKPATRRATRSGSAAKKAPAKRAAPRSGAAPAGGQKSIRVHVLEMLAAENRDFGLAEIIDRIHGEGIAAHDDAVRSITIKLMKDGRVERVGRGMYRLAGRRPAANPAANPTAAAPTAAPTAAPAASAAAPDPSGAGDGQQGGGSHDSGQAPEGAPQVQNYVPPLNLSQPWERR